MNIDIKEIKSRLHQYQPVEKEIPAAFKPASILIPFYQKPEGLALVFMKRPEYQGPHGGQISFPGGAKETSDADDLEVAVRETEEEFGINKKAIEVWGRLAVQQTNVSSFWVTPFVGAISYPTTFKPDKKEVERLLIIPFDHLTNGQNFKIDTYSWKGFKVPSYLYSFNNDVIWGLTARILFNLIHLIKTGEESDTQWPPA